MRHSVLGAACPALSVLLVAFNLAAQVPDLVTNVYRHGVGGYSGSVDASMSTQSLEFTDGNGNTQVGSTEPLPLWWIEYEERVLLRFDNLNLPPGAEVQSALLGLTFDNYEPRAAVTGYYLKVSWNPLASGTHGLGWLYRDHDLPWNVPGAEGVGTDLREGVHFSITDFVGGGVEVKLVALDPAVVQSWISNPTANQGLLLINTVSNAITRVYPSLAGTVDQRPVLTIVYRPGLPPTVAQSATASPNPVAGHTNSVFVLGADEGGEPNLTYTWSAAVRPAGAPEPFFSPNGVNPARQSTVSFAKAGDYALQAIIRNRGGLTATSVVAVTVQSVFSGISVSPPGPKVVTNATQSFTASAVDQFGDPLPIQPAFAWSVTGGGSISASGLFAADAVPGGPYLLRAESGGHTGTAMVVVRLPNQPPSVRLSSPTNGQMIPGQPLTGWADVPVTAEASDADGAVTKVEFYRDGDKLGETTAVPHSLVWGNVAPGTYQLSARASDDAGASSTSAPVTLIVTAPRSSVAPFFAPAEKSGALAVELYPTEGVTGERLVTFGVPFPRGSVGTSELTRLRVLYQGNEIPAHVDTLSVWRHARNPTLDGTSVRVARLQIHHRFTTTWPNPELITVDWGVSDRALNVATLEIPRSAWHQVTNGTFQTSDNVFEPDVLAVLPKSRLCLGLLKPVPMAVLDDSVPATREDPEAMAAVAHWPGYLELDHAVHNFSFSLLNQDDPRVTSPNQCPYRTDFEPWLYDRASALFLLYFRSGHVQALREAVRHTQFYQNQLWPGTTLPETSIGLFKLKWPDASAPYAGGNGAMYSYAECLAYDYWLTGDETPLTALPWVVMAHEQNDEPTRWSPEASTWTERHTAFRLLANVIAYEVLGSASGKSNLLSQTADLIWHQDGAGGLLPANRVDGGLYHYGRQHGDGAENNFVASSWMTVVTLDAMLRAFAVTEDPAIAHFIRRLGTFWKAACKTDDQHQYDTYDAALLYPDYMMTYDGTSDPFDGRQAEMVEHAMDVGSGLAWASYFAAALDRPDLSLSQTATNLYFTYDTGVNYWTRPGGPPAGRTAFRVSPWRKYGWEHRLSGSLPWLLRQPGLTQQVRLEMVRNPAGGLHLVFSGAPGVWRIESSPTLNHWMTLTTLDGVTAPTNIDVPSLVQLRFYRAVSP